MPLFSRDHIAKKFSQGILAVIEALIAYLGPQAQVLGAEIKPALLMEKKEKLKACIGGCRNAYPQWVFARGFNRVLRAGMRFYLLQIEALVELIFVTDYLLSRPFDAQYQEIISHPLCEVIKENINLLYSLQTYFSQQIFLTRKPHDNNDITALETKLRELIPASLELLDLSPDYLVMTAWVQHVKEMRGILESLLLALPE